METVSVQDLVKDVALQMRDCVTGTTSANGTGLDTFVDSRWSNAGGAGVVDQQWVGTQVVFEEPGYTSGGNINPGMHVVVQFTAATGTFRVSPPMRSAGVVPAGLAYFMIHAGGRGVPFLAYQGALRHAFEVFGVQTRLVDRSLTTADQTYTYTIPSTLAGVYQVEWEKTGYTTLRLLPRDWNMKPGSKLWLKNVNLNVGFNWTMALYGIANSALPATLNGTTFLPRDAVIDEAVEYLQRTSRNSADNQRGAQRQQERLRFNRMAGIPNLRMVQP
jgi:hypothetical protein